VEAEAQPHGYAAAGAVGLAADLLLDAV